jgi:hypothetical protein
VTPIPLPTGSCFCGCGTPTNLGAYWAQGHDKKAEADMNSLHHGDQVVQRLVDLGYGPDGKNLQEETLRTGTRELCGHPGCAATGKPGSEGLRRHRATHRLTC